MAELIYLEDEAITYMFVSKALKKLGHSVKHYWCAQELLEDVDQILKEAEGEDEKLYFLLDHVNKRETNPDRIIGSDIAQKVLEKYENAHIVFGTGTAINSLPENIQKAIDNQRVKYLAKPFRTNDLEQIYGDLGNLELKITKNEDEYSTPPKQITRQYNF